MKIRVYVDITVPENSDVNDIIDNMDYNFSYCTEKFGEHVLDTEIVGAKEL